MKSWHHLLTEKPERCHDVLVWDLTTAIQFHQHAVEAQFLAQLLQPSGHRSGRTDQHGAFQRLLIANDVCMKASAYLCTGCQDAVFILAMRSRGLDGSGRNR